MQFNVERSPRYRLSELSRLWIDATEKIYEAEFGLSLSEWRIVAIVGTEQPINAGAIADRGLLKKSHISRLVARLIARGLIAAEVDAIDARKTWLTVTDAGRALYERGARASLDRDALFLSPLTAAERHSLDALLTKLSASAREQLIGD